MLPARQMQAYTQNQGMRELYMKRWGGKGAEYQLLCDFLVFRLALFNFTFMSSHSHPTLFLLFLIGDFLVGVRRE